MILTLIKHCWYNAGLFAEQWIIVVVRSNGSNGLPYTVAYIAYLHRRL